jgi:tetratricopeptide (TPR) repeat protein
MKRIIFNIGYLVLSSYYFNSAHYGFCQMQSMDSVLMESPPLAGTDCGNIHSDRIDDGKICNQIGFQYYENGDYATAIEYYKKAIALLPEYPVPFNNLGVVYLKSNNLELARECFSKAILLNPEYVKAICNLAITSFKTGDLEGAKQLYQKAKSIDNSYVKQRIDNYMKHNE